MATVMQLRKHLQNYSWNIEIFKTSREWKERYIKN